MLNTQKLSKQNFNGYPLAMGLEKVLIFFAPPRHTGSTIQEALRRLQEFRRPRRVKGRARRVKSRSQRVMWPSRMGKRSSKTGKMPCTTGLCGRLKRLKGGCERVKGRSRRQSWFNKKATSPLRNLSFYFPLKKAPGKFLPGLCSNLRIRGIPLADQYADVDHQRRRPGNVHVYHHAACPWANIVYGKFGGAHKTAVHRVGGIAVFAKADHYV